ncbi:MAG: transcription-repair coupling factor [Candidatus Cloacimonadota bacterium]|nr:MAG: transcription-repair coupling factor [Candidatus Cloacimonadota bacterium]PIE77886.1 MAG: transcription-repair coupling factor [Candidatus Delongbacteria bacterium]
MPLSIIDLKIKNSDSYKSLVETIKTSSVGDCIKVNGLRTSLASFVIDQLSKEFKIIYLADSVESCEKFRDDLLTVDDSYDGEIVLPGENYPYCSSDIDDERKGQRLNALDKIYRRKSKIIVSTYRNLFERMPKNDSFDNFFMELNVESEIDLDDLKNNLSEKGFTSVLSVETIGEFSIRGSIIDIYPYSSENPVRLELFGDEIESIRYFDPITQNKIEEIDSVKLFLSDVNKPLKESSNLLNIIPKETIVIFEDCDDISYKLKQYFKDDIEAGYERVQNDDKISVEEKYYSVSDIENLLKEFIVIKDSISDSRLDVKFNIKNQSSYSYDFDTFKDQLKNDIHRGFNSFITCDNPGQAERFGDLFDPSLSSNPKLKIVVAGLHKGFIFPEANIALYTDHQIFGRSRRARQHKKYKKAIPLKEVKKLSFGDFVVHMDHGIGQFGGLEKISVADSVRDVIKIYYKDNDILYVKLDSIDMIHKYNASEGMEPTLSKLGGKQFTRVKEKTKKSIKETARELIKIYALRKEAKGYAFPEDTVWQGEMEGSFEFEDTPDQSRATKDLKKDLESTMPMDRLVCGDVGFGKTEIAVRAAFKAAVSGKQVAVLAPTTILVHQHFQTFKSRMEKYPIKIDSLSRFKSKKEQTEILNQLKEGKIDIIIGTHRVLSKDVEFKDLALLIVDEEQRFGVKHKERIKEMKVNIDVLTLTATPIPRTLHMSLMGVRDLSLINTPPTNRLPVITEIHTYSDSILFEAIMKEKDRGGQIYFLHNRVETIETIRANIERVTPDVKVVVAHGQMKPKDLENIMIDFLHKKYDLLLATTIIENGVDISNANTIIINDAQKFGLSQLYQLRGRIGRSHRQGYAYFLAPPLSKLNATAKKRLETISEFTDLGSGYQIAMKDLEIRGAGNLLGKEQSGFIENVGFELYTKILEDAIQELKKDEFSDILTNVEIKEKIYRTQVNLRKATYLPEEYIEQDSERVEVYRRIMLISNAKDLSCIRDEIRDRFGKEPDEVKNLFSNINLSIEFGKIAVKNLTLLEKTPFHWYFKMIIDTVELEKVERTEVALILEENIDRLRDSGKYSIKTEKNGSILYFYPEDTSMARDKFAIEILEELTREV